MSGDAPTRPDIPAGSLVMPQDEFEMVRWLFEMTGGPAFPGNAAAACRIAAKRNFGGFGDVFARLAEAIDGARVAPFSATCTGPDCGEQFTDSETSEYEFATRERMERLLHADGWQADPVLCPACQPEEA